MTSTQTEFLKTAIRQATALIGGLQWERCDDETGRDCKGLKCPMDAHRAWWILANALDNVDKLSNTNRK